MTLNVTRKYRCALCGQQTTATMDAIGTVTCDPHDHCQASGLTLSTAAAILLFGQDWVNRVGATLTMRLEAW